MRETETAVCPRCGHGIDGRSRHPPECAKCPEGYCEATADPGDPASATLAAIARKLDFMRPDIEEPGSSPAARLIAGHAALLLAAVEAALKLADEWEADSFIVDPEISLREAVTAALAGTGKEASENVSDAR